MFPLSEALIARSHGTFAENADVGRQWSFEIPVFLPMTN